MAWLIWTSYVPAVVWLEDRSCPSFGHAAVRWLESRPYSQQRLGRQLRAPIVSDARIRTIWLLRSPPLGSLARGLTRLGRRGGTDASRKLSRFSVTTRCISSAR